MLHLEVTNHHLALGCSVDVQPPTNLHNPARVQSDLPVVDRGGKLSDQLDLVTGQTGRQFAQLCRLLRLVGPLGRGCDQPEEGQVAALFH